MNRLADLTWSDAAQRARGTVVAVPVGATEQHGPHLPLSTDTAIAEELAERLATARSDVVVAPPVAYGSSGEHAGFAGTLSIGAEALRSVLVELGRSADAFAGMVFVSAHGGNARPVRHATALLVGEGRPVRSWSPPPAPLAGRADAHAGFTETSVMIALTGRHLLGPPGCETPLRDLASALVAGGVRSVSGNGVLGDATGASAAAGRRILAAWEADLLSALRGWPPR